jgi:hypothetical protein
MALKIAKGSAGQRITLRLSARIRSADVEVISEEMTGKAERMRAVMVPDIPKIDPDRHPDLGASAWLFRDKVLHRLFHGK